MEVGKAGNNMPMAISKLKPHNIHKQIVMDTSLSIALFGKLIIKEKYQMIG